MGTSGVGDGLRLTALPLLAATLTKSPMAVAAVAAAQGLPWLLFSLPAGALVDRGDRKRIVVGINFTRALLVAGLALAVPLGVASIPLLGFVAFVLTTGETFAEAATRATLPEVVPAERLDQANGRVYATETVTVQLVGPPAGSSLFEIQRAVPFVLDAVSFLVSALCFLRVPVPQSAARAETRDRPSLWTEIGEGVRYVLAQPILRALLLPILVMNLASEAVFAVFVLFALHDLGLSRSLYGLLFVAFAVGALIGSAVATRIRSRAGTSPAVVGSIVLFGAPFIVMGLSSNVLVVAGAMVAMGIGEAVWGVLTMSMRQTLTPSRLLGRVLNVFRLIGWGGLSLGAILGGLAAQRFGLRAPILGAGVLILLTAIGSAPTLSTRRIEAATPMHE